MPCLQNSPARDVMDSIEAPAHLEVFEGKSKRAAVMLLIGCQIENFTIHSLLPIAYEDHACPETSGRNYANVCSCRQ